MPLGRASLVMHLRSRLHLVRVDLKLCDAYAIEGEDSGFSNFLEMIGMPKSVEGREPLIAPSMNDLPKQLQNPFILSRKRSRWWS